MGDREDAKDVMQEVFLRAFKAYAEFTGTASPLSWLYRITTNICLNRLRDTGRRRQILDQAFSGDEPASGTSQDAALTVRALLGQVPEDVQEIAVYYFVDQMSQDEIASLLEIPRRTIGYRLEQFRSLTLAAAQERGIAS
jgi:RNA polymerase sigma-70 factor (ECF subfamily)